MLNEGKDIDNGSVCSGEEDISMYSMLSEANDAGDNKSKCFNPDESVENGKNNGLKQGLLILGGEDDEEEVADDKEERSKRGMASTVLSVPESVFLPSEVRSMAVVSGVTRVRDETKAKENKDGDRTGKKSLRHWNQLQSVGSRWMAGIIRSAGSLKTMPLFHMFVIILVTLIASISWRSHNMWKNEALRLREELQQHKSLLPLTVSLIMEHEAVIKRQKLLEEAIEREKRNRPNRYEDIFSQGESDDPYLSINNCYVEASLSLGRCSKEWQSWWYDAPHTGSSSDEDSPEGFADDMSKLVGKLTDSLASTTSQSYSFIEKSLKELSYDGIKDVFAWDDYVQSIVQSAPKMASNDTGDRTHS